MYYDLFGKDFFAGTVHPQRRGLRNEASLVYESAVDHLNDEYSFDPASSLNIEPFIDIIGRNFKQPAEGLGWDDSPSFLYVAYYHQSHATPVSRKFSDDIRRTGGYFNADHDFGKKFSSILPKALEDTKTNPRRSIFNYLQQAELFNPALIRYDLALD
jgi:nitric oxide synthase oxygenase domain/subunit